MPLMLMFLPNSICHPSRVCLTIDLRTRACPQQRVLADLECICSLCTHLLYTVACNNNAAFAIVAWLLCRFRWVLSVICQPLSCKPSRKRWMESACWARQLRYPASVVRTQCILSSCSALPKSLQAAVYRCMCEALSHVRSLNKALLP